ncbi:tyrosine-protein phosphatase [Maritimibacter sp. 55A14]|uniref:tyrosine-protein phosphatase n=1 Tax=Maritimibacter sp. 55A14 TaxID=2174844 RepID=UPI001304C2B3|nr:tyrosine-protein phosphatase [Maritimibacter sp. 55A14]
MTQGDRLSTPLGRAGAWWELMMTDHGILRVLWPNMHRIAPGVWRANQPSPLRLRRWRARGIRSVVNLRGAEPKAPYLLEAEACAALGLRLESLRFSARRFAPPARLIEMLDLFARVERPFVMHCKSGSDRSGLAAALYLMDAEGVPVDRARRQLGLRYLHLSFTNRGAVDHLLDAYARDSAARPISLRDWLETRYDHVALEAEFAALRGKRDLVS